MTNIASYIALGQAILAMYTELKTDGTFAQIGAGVKAAAGVFTSVIALLHTHTATTTVTAVVK